MARSSRRNTPLATFTSRTAHSGTSARIAVTSAFCQDDCKVAVTACHSERSEESYPQRRDPSLGSGCYEGDFAIVLGVLPVEIDGDACHVVGVAPLLERGIVKAVQHGADFLQAVVSSFADMTTHLVSCVNFQYVYVTSQVGYNLGNYIEFYPNHYWLRIQQSGNINMR